MKVTQLFTGQGLLGAILFVVAAPVTGFSYLQWSSTPSYSGSNFWLYVAGASSILHLASVPLMLIGRSYHVEGAASVKR